ncbi:MAG: hypothetical protein ABI859_16880 [Pseudomonadota bacterium]
MSSLQLDLPTDADEDTVRAALRDGKAERKRSGRRVPGEKISAEDLFALQCERDGLPKPVRQAQFALKLGRKWAADFCWHEHRVIVEVEGLVVRRLAGQIVVTGRHASIGGIKGDMEKYNTAAILGWHVLRFEQGMVKSRAAIEVTKAMLSARGWKR